MGDFYLNHFSLEKHGDQPIRVIFPQIAFEFDNIKSLILKQYPGVPLNNFTLSYLTENRCVIGPNVSYKRLQLHDTFLSFLWCYCYGILTTGPLTDFDIIRTNKGRGLLTYAKNILLKEYSPWPADLPSPEIPNDPTIATANAVFLAAMVTILYHEFSHILLKHLESKDFSIENARKMEYEADKFAVDAIRSTTNFNETTINIAIICAMSCLAFGNDKFNNASKHPEPEDRLTMCLKHLDKPPGNLVWGIASWVFIEWQLYFGFFGESIDNTSLESAYYSIIADYKKFKK